MRTSNVKMGACQYHAGHKIRLFSHGLFLLAACILWLISSPAYAAVSQGNDYRIGFSNDPTRSDQLTTSGTSLTVQDFNCVNGSPVPPDGLFINPDCDDQQGMRILGVFANVVCRVENIFATMLGLMYCGMQEALLPPLLAVLILYVTVYGALLILGMVPQNFKEGLTRIAKIGLVGMIALNADIAIQVGYKFYVSFAQTTAKIAFSAFDVNRIAGSADYDTLSNAGYMIRASDNAAPCTDDEGVTLRDDPNTMRDESVLPCREQVDPDGSHWMMRFDSVISRYLDFFLKGGVGIIMVMLLLFLFMPPLFLLLAYLAFSIFRLFITSIIGYLLALLGITFLFSLAPIFVCFALFKTTSSFFESWLQYLASFALQMLVVFTFITFFMMLDFVTFLEQIGTLVRNYNYTGILGWLFFPFGSGVYTLCKVRRDGEDGLSGNIQYFDPITHAPVETAYQGFPQCIPPYSFDKMILPDGSLATDPALFPPGLRPDPANPDSIEQIRALVTLMRADAAPGFIGDPIQEIIDKANADLTLPFFKMLTTTDLMAFIMMRFLVVAVLTHILIKFMERIPHIATSLAGTGFSGRLGGGADANINLGVQNDRDVLGTKTGWAAFKKSAFQDTRIRDRTPVHFLQAVRAGVGGMGRGILGKSLERSRGLGLNREARQEFNMSAARRKEVLEGNLIAGNRERAGRARPGINGRSPGRANNARGGGTGRGGRRWSRGK